MMEVKLVIDNNSIDNIIKALSLIESLVSNFKKQLLYNISSDNIQDLSSPSDTPNTTEKENQKQSYTFEEVRSYLTDRSRNGFTSEVKALVTKYGSGKLSSISPDSYPALMLEAQFRCREPLTKADIVKRVDELISEGYKDQISEIFTRSFATSADDLLEENYAAFMIDSWGLDHE